MISPKRKTLKRRKDCGHPIQSLSNFKITYKNSNKSMNIAIFTRDLRKDNNELLQHLAKDNLPILCIFIFNPTQIGK